MILARLSQVDLLGSPLKPVLRSPIDGQLHAVDVGIVFEPADGSVPVLIPWHHVDGARLWSAGDLNGLVDSDTTWRSRAR
jgi:hypothetical protein